MFDGASELTDIRLIQAYRLNDAAMTRWKGGQVASAISMLRRAMTLAPDLHNPVSNLGLVMWRLGETDAAAELLDRAAGMAPDDPIIQGNLGVFHAAMGNHHLADHYVGRAAADKPGEPGPVWDQALCWLGRGEWSKAWAGYDARITMHAGDKQYPRFRKPLWQGESLDGKTIFVQGEQGIGDRIQFARYIPEIKRRWPTCKILFSPYDDLIPLLWGYRDVCELVPIGVPFPAEADYVVFLQSLLRQFDVTPERIIPDPGYIRARILDQHTRAPSNLPSPNLPSLRIGVAWTGNPAHLRNRDRSIPLELLLPLAEDPRIALFSLQAGPGAADIKSLGCEDLINPLGTEIAADGWVGTATALMQFDLIVTVDTSIAHLAGVLELPTIVMLPKHADWRWGQTGSRTPWYRTLKLVRQHNHGDWIPVLRTVERKLTRMADERFSEN